MHVGVFSSSNTILSSANLNRVVNAIDAGPEWYSPNGCVTAQPPTGHATDIPEDFPIPGAGLTCLAWLPGSPTYTVVVVPPGATYIFISTEDEYFTDNGDADADYFLRIARLCSADFDSNEVINSSDISAFTTAWLDDVNNGTFNADFDGNGVVDSSDTSAFLTAWNDQVNNGC